MKKKIIVGGLILLSLAGLCVNIGRSADPYGGSLGPKELENFFYDHKSQCVQGVITLTGNATFYGYATDFAFKVDGGSVAWTGNWNSDQVGGLFDGDSLSMRFQKPVSSPTIVTFTLQSGATLQYWVGGLKR